MSHDAVKGRLYVSLSSLSPLYLPNLVRTTPQHNTTMLYTGSSGGGRLPTLLTTTNALHSLHHHHRPLSFWMSMLAAGFMGGFIFSLFNALIFSPRYYGGGGES